VNAVEIRGEMFWTIPVRVWDREPRGPDHCGPGLSASLVRL